MSYRHDIKKHNYLQVVPGNIARLLFSLAVAKHFQELIYTCKCILLLFTYKTLYSAVQVGA